MHNDNWGEGQPIHVRCTLAHVVLIEQIQSGDDHATLSLVPR